jgi:DNA-binding NtrC family response regulator
MAAAIASRVDIVWKLLIIDDEASIRFSIQQIFRRDPSIVLSAENGQDGLAIIASESPDVVLLDARLGAESGLELLAKILQMDPKCPVILITGYGSPGTQAEAMSRGAFDYLVKPLDVNRLKQVVKLAVAARRISRESD